MFGWFIGRNKGFQPNTLTNLQLWLDATRINQADNTAVASWADQSGNAYNAEQSTSAARPTYRTNQLNGLPSVVFDGTDDRLSLVSGALGMLRNVAGATVFVVVRYGTSATLQNSFFMDTAGATSRIRIDRAANKTFSVGGRRLDANSFQSIASAQTDNGNFVIHSVFFNYQNTLLQQFINGGLDGQKTDFQTAGNTSDTNSTEIVVGTASLNGAIAEIIVYNRALNTSELAQVHRYLSRKWGIQLA